MIVYVYFHTDIRAIRSLIFSHIIVSHYFLSLLLRFIIYIDIIISILHIDTLHFLLLLSSPPFSSVIFVISFSFIFDFFAFFFFAAFHTFSLFSLLMSTLRHFLLLHYAFAITFRFHYCHYFAIAFHVTFFSSFSLTPFFSLFLLSFFFIFASHFRFLLSLY